MSLGLIIELFETFIECFVRFAILFLELIDCGPDYFLFENVYWGSFGAFDEELVGDVRSEHESEEP